MKPESDKSALLIRNVLNAILYHVCTTAVYFSKPGRTQPPPLVVVLKKKRTEKSLVYIVSMWYFLCPAGLGFDPKTFDAGCETQGLGSCLM